MLFRCPLVGAVLLALAAPLAAAQTADPPQEIPFQATVVVLHEDGVVELKLTNTGAREAVAWTIRFERQLRDGRRVRTSITVDRYEIDLLSRAKLMRKPATIGIRPGATIVSRIQLPPETVSVTAAVTCVVLEDGTGVGDQAGISSVFAERAREEGLAAEWLATFAQAAAARSEEAAAQVLREAVASATGHLRRGSPYGQAMMLVKRADEGTRTIRKEAKMYLRYLEMLVEEGRRRPPRGV